MPIVPDEARTFGMEALFRQVGIYSHVGQLYEPVDSDTLLYYKEAKDGQIFEEGITEAGSMSTFIAAGTAYATHGINTIPFFIYYSMFGFQRIGDLIWAAADARCRGFLLGGTAGRTTLAGEGLQHQDGHSHVLSLTVPSCMSYDPAFAYEIAIIIQDGIRRMYGNGESIFYYLTVMNEAYEMPAMPKGDDVREGILKGLYRFRATAKPKAKLRAQLLGSGAILPEVIKAQAILEEKYNVGADIWSVTSYNELYRDGHAAERWNLLHPGETAEGAVRHAEAGRSAGRLRGGVGLHEGAARHDQPLAAAPDCLAGHRRLRPQRSARRPAQPLRGGRAVRRGGDVVGAGAGTARSTRRSCRRPSRIWGLTRRRRTRRRRKGDTWLTLSFRNLARVSPAATSCACW